VLRGPRDAKNLAVAPLATISESKGSGAESATSTSRRSQSTPVTVAIRKVTLSAFRR